MARFKLEYFSETLWNENRTSKKTKVYHPTLMAVPLDAIESRCFAVEENPGLKESLTADEYNDPKQRNVILIQERRKWPHHFICYPGDESSDDEYNEA